MHKVEFKVIKRCFEEEIAKEYGSEGIGLCPAHKDGDVFYSTGGKPNGLCDDAWMAMQHYVFALANNVETFYNGDWVKKPGTAICSCNDGLRPVIFKIERMEE